MDTFSAMLTFVKVVEAKSFAEAARQLRVPKSTLSRRISRLEEYLGVQLLVRTTRTLNMTDIGEAYFQRCKTIVQEVQETEELLTQMHMQPQGILRVSLPVDGSVPLFSQLIAEFLHEYKDIQVEALSTTRQVHLVEEGFDVAIRASTLSDSTLIARRIMAIKNLAVASPAYLEEYGTPQTTEDLSQHICLLHGLQDSHLQWRIDGHLVQVKGRLRSNNLEFLRQNALSGLGITILPEVFVRHNIQSGQLISILNPMSFGQANVYVVYPGSRYISPKIRAFVDFCIKYFEPYPDLPILKN